MANRRIAKKRKSEAGVTAESSITAALQEAAATVDKPEKEVNIFIQYQGREMGQQEIADTILKDWNSAGRDEADIRKMDVYIKPEENKAYYVINDEHSGSVSL